MMIACDQKSRLWLSRTGRVDWYQENGARKRKTVKYQPTKFWNGTPKNPPPSIHIQNWPMVDALGSNDRSQLTISTAPTSGTAHIAKRLHGPMRLRRT